MSALIFDRFVLLSNPEERARVLNFSPRLNVLHGPNSVGKSTILKAIMWSLGAPPKTMPLGWKKLEAITLLHFHVGESYFCILRRGGHFFLFEEDELVGSGSSITSTVGPWLAAVVDFRLRLPNRADGEPVTPPPAYYLAPYYIDQDDGWTSPLASFDRLQQFSRWQGPLVSYLLGVSSHRQIDLNIELQQAKAERQDPAAQLVAIQGVVRDVEAILQAPPFDLREEDFHLRIEQLSKQVDGLHQDEQGYLQKLAILRTRERDLSSQLQILSKAREEYAADLEYAASPDVPDHVECPTCGAHYANDFASRFSIAMDHERCLDLEIELTAQRSEILAELREHSTGLHGVRASLGQFREIMATKVGETTLAEIAKAMGRIELHDATQHRAATIAKTLEKVDEKIANLSSDIRDEAKATRKRRKEVTGEFHGYLQRFADNLDVGPFARQAPKRLRFKISETGSARPRALLAYSLAFSSVASARGECAQPPLVIDSPNQQDMDASNWANVLETIRRVAFAGDDHPRQLLVATVEGADDLKPDQAWYIPDKQSAMIGHDYEEASRSVDHYLMKVIASSVGSS